MWVIYNQVGKTSRLVELILRYLCSKLKKKKNTNITIIVLATHDIDTHLKKNFGSQFHI